jgi:hypothetical protein
MSVDGARLMTIWSAMCLCQSFTSAVLVLLTDVPSNGTTLFAVYCRRTIKLGTDSVSFPF